ncbi:MAG: alginate lyase family protein [Candidatus Hydrogenedentes bacterium]|nr:alginate lyase family protein [Candidatus Hydrogenedentota bacterium]
MLSRLCVAVTGLAILALAVSGCPRPRADTERGVRASAGGNSIRQPFTDKELFAALDLDLPGLEDTKRAVACGNYPSAKAALNAFMRSRFSRSNFFDPSIDLAYFGEAELLSAEESARTGRFISRYSGRVFQFNPDGFSLDDVDLNDVSQLDSNYLFGLDEMFLRYRPAYFVTKDPIYLQRSYELIRSYYELFHGGARDGAADVPLSPWERWSLRHRIEHLVAYFVLFEAGDLDPEVTAMALKILLEDQRVHVPRGPLWEGNAVEYMCFTGAFTSAFVYPFKESGAWYTDQTGRLWGGMLQLMPDGCNSDLSPTYAGAYGYWADLYKPIVWMDSPWRLENVPDDVQVKMEALGEFLMNTTKPSGEYAPFNDSDRLSYFPEYVRGLGAFFDYFGRDDFKWFATNQTEGAPPAYHSYPQTSKTPSYSGLYVMRDGWDANAIYLASDFGPGWFAHSHADYGSFVLHAFGEDLIDEGRSAQYESALHVNYSTKYWAHNTIAVDGLGQEKGALGRPPFGQPVPAQWVTNASFDYVAGEYPLHVLHPAELPGVVHRRAIYYAKPDYFLVLDRVDGSGPHNVWIKFQLGPSVSATLYGNVVHGVSESGPSVWIIPGDARPAPGVITGQTEPRYDGWVSPDNRLAAPVAAPSIEYEEARALPLNYVTVIQPARKSTRPALLVSSVPLNGPSGSGIELRVAPPSGAYEDVYIIRHEGTIVMGSDGGSVDGSIAHFHYVADELERISVVNAVDNSFSFDGQTVNRSFGNATSAYASSDDGFSEWHAE